MSTKIKDEYLCDDLSLTEQSQSDKCGDIFVTENGFFSCFCIVCKQIFDSIENFTEHILKLHLGIMPISKSHTHLYDIVPLDISNNSLETKIRQNENITTDKAAVTGKNETLIPTCQYSGKHFREISTFEIPNQVSCIQPMSRKEKLKIELPDINCKYCDKIFQKTALLKKHEELHENSPFKCNTCPKKFMTRNSMEDHIRTHTGEKPFKCTYCPISFANESNFKRHTLIHIGERNYVCTLGCGKAFFTARDRTGHERSHTGEKPFVCELCGRYFAFQHQLSLHKKRVHMDKKNWPHKCVQCDKVFLMLKELREHSVVHTGERPFECDLCSGRFSKPNSLREHRKLHSGVKKHMCKICNKAFAQTAGLYSHMKSHGVIKGITDLFL